MFPVLEFSYCELLRPCLSPHLFSPQQRSSGIPRFDVDLVETSNAFSDDCALRRGFVDSKRKHRRDIEPRRTSPRLESRGRGGERRRARDPAASSSRRRCRLRSSARVRRCFVEGSMSRRCLTLLAALPPKLEGPSPRAGLRGTRGPGEGPGPSDPRAGHRTGSGIARGREHRNRDRKSASEVEAESRKSEGGERASDLGPESPGAGSIGTGTGSRHPRSKPRPRSESGERTRTEIRSN